MSLFIQILRKRAEARKEYFGNYEGYVREIGRYFQKKLGDVRVFVFGSAVAGTWDQESDIDVLVVSPKTPFYSYQRSALIAEIKLKLGSFNPFEIHLVTLQEYSDWYADFIKDKIREIEIEPNDFII